MCEREEDRKGNIQRWEKIGIEKLRFIKYLKFDKFKNIKYFINKFQLNIRK